MDGGNLKRNLDEEQYAINSYEEMENQSSLEIGTLIDYPIPSVTPKHMNTTKWTHQITFIYTYH